jgi:hypothetical protein
MTLIATAINKKNIPFLISDLLISSDTGIANFQSPTNHFPINQYLPQDSTNKPESFSQKTYIINKDLCVMLAGSVYEMKNFLDDLIKYFNHHELTRTHLFNFLNSYDYTNEFKNLLTA